MAIFYCFSMLLANDQSLYFVGSSRYEANDICTSTLISSTLFATEAIPVGVRFSKRLKRLRI